MLARARAWGWPLLALWLSGACKPDPSVTPDEPAAETGDAESSEGSTVRAPAVPTTPMPSTSSTTSITANVGLSGLSCAEYGDVEEALLIMAIASLVDGVETHNIGETACSDVARRRRRDLL